ncbi:MAG: group II intron reverse transcriptase/maturase, partial [Cyanobacteria bacterium 13_1_40CM_2_61_4]
MRQLMDNETPQGVSDEWSPIPWRKLERYIYRLQKRIYKAKQRHDTRAVRGLKRVLKRSKAAKTLAVRQVTQDNRGKRTAGIDGVKNLKPTERLQMAATLSLQGKASPVRRVWIPKPGKDEKRPLGIPTMRDRAKQALAKMALEPEWEAVFEPNSYGFRPGRGCHDAIEQVFIAMRGEKYILEADIKGCFDNIAHEALLDKVNDPALRPLLKGWLKAGIMDGEVFQETPQGTPQGGVISPLLANIALHGLEEDTKEALKLILTRSAKPYHQGWERARRTLQVIRYADDFVVIHKELSVIKEAEKYIAEWVGNMGLQLKPEKTRIVHSLLRYEGNEPGFNFLGFNCRQYRKAQDGKIKTLIKPEKDKLRRHLMGIKESIRKLETDSQEEVNRINSKIRGWTNYYRTCVAAETFKQADNVMYWQLSEWTKKSSPKGSIRRKMRQYFRAVKNRNWVFTTPKGKELLRHDATKIVRHIKVQGSRSPFDGDWAYWATRLGHNPLLSPRRARMLKKQKGRCGYCKLHFRQEDILEIHHMDGNHKNNKKDNLMLIHGHCHDQITAQMQRTHDKGSVTEEPCAGKLASTVL